MSRALIARDPDLGRLVDDGYSVGIEGNHLVVRDVPYVDESRQIRFGFVAYPVELSGDRIVSQTDHRLWFGGFRPCDEAGRPLNLANPEQRHITNELVAEFMLSSKPGPAGGRPDGGYPDDYSKVTSYVRILSHPAMALDASVTATPGSVWSEDDTEGPFRYRDTASSRAGLSHMNAKFTGERIAIVGLGGSGSYILDQVAKTPVDEIVLIDGDTFDNHNAFRAPGAASLDDLRTRPMKVDYLGDMYSRMHCGIIRHPAFLDADNLQFLAGCTFVFIAIDEAASKPAIVEWLERQGTPFIDVGMGVEEIDDRLTALLRVTTSAPGMRDHVRQNHRIPTDAAQHDDYARNIQIADLNAMNAILAVLRWKRLIGYYADETGEGFSTFAVSVNDITNEAA